MTAPAIEIVRLAKVFYHQRGWRLLSSPSTTARTTAVDNITFSVNEGEIFGILGPNGAGKTTLIKILCTLLLPTSGTARIFGNDVVHKSSRVRQDIGLVTSDERSFYWRLTGRQNLHFFATLYNISSHQVTRRIDELIDLLQLEEIIDLRFNEYSTGMKQKLAITRGLLNQPRLLFMDEPTRGLDPVARCNFLKIIRETVVKTLKGTVVLCTNIIEEAEQLCDRIAIINHGKLVRAGRIEEIKAATQEVEHYRVRVKHLTNDHIVDLNKIEGIVNCSRVYEQNGFIEMKIELTKDTAALSNMFKYIVRSHCDILSCSKEDNNFELIFRAMTQETINITP
jgi:ABC-2 type transport system ATP-binding protein